MSINIETIRASLLFVITIGIGPIKAINEKVLFSVFSIFEKRKEDSRKNKPIMINRRPKTKSII